MKSVLPLQKVITVTVPLSKSTLTMTHYAVASAWSSRLRQKVTASPFIIRSEVLHEAHPGHEY